MIDKTRYYIRWIKKEKDSRRSPTPATESLTDKDSISRRLSNRSSNSHKNSITEQEGK